MTEFPSYLLMPGAEITNPDDALGRDFAHRLTQQSDIADHLQFMHDTVLKYRNPVVIEMGVRTGNSTCALLYGAVKAEGQMWSADINESQVPGYMHQIPEWHFIQGDAVSAPVLKWMPKRADVVFMDTSHTYEQQLAELRKYVPRVKPGGTVLIHDTQCVPLDNFASDSFIAKTEPEGPVKDALDAFCEESGLTWTNRDSELPYYGMGVIEIPKRQRL